MSHPSLHRQTLGDLLRRTRQRFPHKPAIRCGDTAWTYAEFDDTCNALANGLAGLGVAVGDRVAVIARNSHAFAALRFAVARLGAVLAALTFWQVSKLPRRSTAMLSVLSMPHFWPRLDAGRRLRMELTKLAVLLLTAWTFAAWPVRISWKAKFR